MVSVESKNELDQVVTQLGKLIDVIKIVNLSEVDSIERELVMIKVRADKSNRAELIDIVNIFRPQLILIGGMMSAYADEILDELREILKRDSFGGDKGAIPEIAVAQLGSNAGIIGAAGL